MGNLKTDQEPNMNLALYDFNNPSVISEENTRNMLRSQTTDRGPSRKLRSKGRHIALVSSHAKTRPTNEKNPINPVETSGEFDIHPGDDFDADTGYAHLRNQNPV